MATTTARTLTPIGKQAHTEDRSLQRNAERRVNQGGEQGHDDYGLPPVDIEIPDDARELYRDVQAYHRELRAMRRHQRSMRWRAPFRRSGIAIPLLAGCLIAALVAVMVSAMFTANPYIGAPGQRPSGQAGAAGASTHRPTRSSARPSATPSGGLPGPAPATRAVNTRLPGKTISVAGKDLRLSSLTSTALAIVPANCHCTAALRDLLRQVESAGVIVYLVGVRGASLASLNRIATASAAATKSARVAADRSNALASAYRPVGLTVLLVDAHGSVTVASGLRPGLMLERQLQLLRPAK